MELPKLRKRPVERDMISAFGGIQRTASVPEGKFADMMNLTSDHAPVMAVRSPRRIETLSGSVTGMAGSDDLYYVVQGKMYRKSYPTGTISQIMSGLSTTLDTEIVLMSGYVLALGLGQHQVVKMTGGLAGTQEDLAKSVSGQFSYSPCTLDGTVIQPEKGSTPPAAPADRSYWVDTSPTPNVLKQWGAEDGVWTSGSTA